MSLLLFLLFSLSSFPPLFSLSFFSSSLSLTWTKTSPGWRPRIWLACCVFSSFERDGERSGGQKRREEERRKRRKAFGQGGKYLQRRNSRARSEAVEKEKKKRQPPPFPHRHAAVGAADPQVLGRLLVLEPVEVARVFGLHALGPAAGERVESLFFVFGRF